MLAKIKESYGHINFLTPLDLIKIASLARLHKVKKGEYLIKEGDLNYSVFMVKKGLLRHYVIDRNGNEVTLLFVDEKKHTSSIETIFNDRMANENIVALEDSTLIRLDYRKVNKITQKNNRLLRFQNQSLKETISSNVNHIKFLTLLTAEERYEHFCKTYPNMEQRIKQKHLASYMGVTPTSLSRIRGRVDNVK